jgi:hypothetical protein
MITVNIRDILTRSLNEARERIKNNLAITGTNASGRTSESLEVVVEGSTGTLFGRQAFGTVETGRKGGRVPAGFRQIIYQWMQDKGVHADVSGRRSQYSADMSMAYLIARKIANEGSRLYRDGGRDDIYSNVLHLTIERVSSEITNVYLVNIQSILRDGNN